MRARELLHQEDGGLDPRVPAMAREVSEASDDALDTVLTGLIREPERRDRDYTGEVECRVGERIKTIISQDALPGPLGERAQGGRGPRVSDDRQR